MPAIRPMSTRERRANAARWASAALCNANGRTDLWVGLHTFAAALAGLLVLGVI